MTAHETMLRRVYNDTAQFLICRGLDFQRTSDGYAYEALPQIIADLFGNLSPEEIADRLSDPSIVNE